MKGLYANMSNKNNFSAIILAAGAGRRMNSSKSKVLHNVGGKPMILRTIETLRKLEPQEIVLVANSINSSELKQLAPDCKIALQEKPLGTGHAAETGLSMVDESSDAVAVLYGDDTAFYNPETIKSVLDHHVKTKAEITFVTIIKDNPHGLGRIVRKNGKLNAIMEEKDATDGQKKIKEVNDGLYFFDKKHLVENIASLNPSATTGELYLTDLIEKALKNKRNVQTFTLSDDSQWHGINNQLELAKANFKLNKNIHIMGICGSGTAAVAGIASNLGYSVTGCDTHPGNTYLDNSNMKVSNSHNIDHISDISCLIISPAITKLEPDNQEIAEAKNQGIPVLSWQEFQGSVLAHDKFTVAIAGGYGKSTTTAMVGKILEDQGLDPTVMVGAKVLSWGRNYRVGQSKYYVLEADEYNNNFLNYYPNIAIILNMAWDHPDFFENEGSVLNSYITFANQIKDGGTLVSTTDVLSKLSKYLKKEIILVPIESFTDIKLALIGDFRKENANAALTVTKMLNINLYKAKKTLVTFDGLARRLEYKGIIKGVKFYDDYAVQPYTIAKTINALKQTYKNNKVTLVLEPHTFSRVNKYFDSFVSELMNTKIDRVLITETYAAREKGNKSELSVKLAASLGNHATFTGSIKDTAAYIRGNLDQYDVICTMGAGDVYAIFDLIKNG